MKMRAKAKAQARNLIELLIVFCLLHCLAGCDMGEQAAEKAREAARAPAEEAAQAWLQRALPGAELLGAEPYVFHQLGVAPYRLTDLVSGRYRYDGREQAYWLDTSNGEAWLEVGRETADDLCVQSSRAVMEALGLSVGPDAPEATDGFAYFDIGTAEQIDVLPAEFAFSGAPLEQLVRNPGNRLPLTVSFTRAVPDDGSLSRLTFSDVLRVQEECGLQLFNVQLASRSESVLLSYDHMTYRKLSDDGKPEYTREERLDAGTGEVLVEEAVGTT